MLSSSSGGAPMVGPSSLGISKEENSNSNPFTGVEECEKETSNQKSTSTMNN